MPYSVRGLVNGIVCCGVPAVQPPVTPPPQPLTVPLALTLPWMLVLPLMPVMLLLVCTSALVAPPTALMATDPEKSRLPCVSTAFVGLYGANRYSALSSRFLARALLRAGDQASE